MTAVTTTDIPTIYQFLTENPAGVLATVNPETDSPHAATVYFVPKLDVEGTLTLSFMSLKHTEKSQNIAKNERIAVVVSDIEQQRTLQIQGVAEEVTDIEKQNKLFGDIIEANKFTGSSLFPPITQLKPDTYGAYIIHLTNARLLEFTD